MVRGLYLAGTGMLVQRNNMDVITNNISNADTLGYKKDAMLSRSFKDLLIDRMNDPSVINQTSEVGPLGTGVHIDEVKTFFEQGTPEQTQLATDMCIVGDAFFVVNTPDGERYTRAGNFTLDAAGYLVNSDGYYVQGENGNIQLNNDRFAVNQHGDIYDMDTDERIDSLRLVEFEDMGALRKGGDSLFYDFGEANPQEAENTEVLQGYIETSNVNIAQEMVSMLITNRAYDSNQSAVRMIDNTLQRAVNDIARF